MGVVLCWKVGVVSVIKLDRGICVHGCVLRVSFRGAKFLNETQVPLLCLVRMGVSIM